MYKPLFFTNVWDFIGNHKQTELILQYAHIQLLTLEMNFRTSKHLPATEKVSKSKTQEGTPLSTCDMNRDYFSIMKTEKPKFEIILEVKLPLFYRQPHHPRLLLLPPTSSTNLHLVSFLSIFSNAPLS